MRFLLLLWVVGAQVSSGALTMTAPDLDVRFRHYVQSFGRPYAPGLRQGPVPNPSRPSPLPLSLCQPFEAG